MAGCSVVVLMVLFAIAILAVLAAIFGLSSFCLVLGIILLIQGFTSLKKKDDEKKHRKLRIALMIIGGISLLIASGGTFILIAFLSGKS